MLCILCNVLSLPVQFRVSTIFQQGGISMCQDNIEDKSGRDIYVSRQQWRQIREGYLCVKTTLNTDIPPWFIFNVVLTHRYPSLNCLHCCLDTDIPPWFVFNVVLTHRYPSLNCLHCFLDTDIGISMCQDNIEVKSGRDIYVSRQHWRQIREGYLCQDNIEDKSGRDICVKTTLKSNQGGIYMCQDNIEVKSGRDIYVSDIPPWFVFNVVLTHRYPSLICLQCCLDT
jgi:hypothetical protein